VHRLITLASLITLVSVSAQARADDFPPDAGAPEAAAQPQPTGCARPEGATESSLSGKTDRERLDFLATTLEDEGAAARRWTFVWGATYAGLTAVQLGVMGLFDKADQPDWYWGALSSGVGVAFTVFGPLRVASEGTPFAQRARRQGLSDQETCQLLVEGEKMLREDADSESFNRSWFIHVGNVLFNAGFGLILGLGYGHWTSGIINALVGTAIGELTIFTMPNQLIPGWSKYRGAPVTFHLVPTAGPGVGLVVRF